MAYQRVIPRDLFNEAKLLKCLGQLWLDLERLPPGVATLDHHYDIDPGFLIDQHGASGALYCDNVLLYARRGGEAEHVALCSPYNSKAPYPLQYFDTDDQCWMDVFKDDGEFTDLFKRYLMGERE